MLGAFSPSTGHTLPDRYIEGTCPICGFESARGDQCDNCGNLLDPIDLINPRSRINGETPEFRETNHLFLDLPAFADQPAEWIEKQKHWRPNVRNFSLRSSTISAAPDHARPRLGRPHPGRGYAEDDEQADLRLVRRRDRLPEGRDRVGAQRAATPTPGASGGRTPTSRHYYFMGKDNIAFHTVIWPPCCSATARRGVRRRPRRAQLPYDVVASEFLTMEGKQFSSSRNVVIYVRDFLEPLRRRMRSASS